MATSIFRIQDKISKNRTSVTFHQCTTPYADQCDEWKAEPTDAPFSGNGNKKGDVVCVNGEGDNYRLVKQVSVSVGKQF